MALFLQSLQKARDFIIEWVESDRASCEFAGFSKPTAAQGELTQERDVANVERTLAQQSCPKCLGCVEIPGQEPRTRQHTASSRRRQVIKHVRGLGELSHGDLQRRQLDLRSRK